MGGLDELVLTNYCHPDCRPLMNIMRLNREDAFGLAREMAEQHPETTAFYRFADFDNYYELRKAQDAYLYCRFRELGGQPEETHPLSFVIGDSDYLREWFGNGTETKLPLKGIAPEHISFTVGDSGAIYQRDGAVELLTMEGFASLLDEYDGSVSALLKSKGRGYVEVQLWSDRYVKPLPKGENADGTDR